MAASSRVSDRETGDTMMVGRFARIVGHRRFAIPAMIIPCAVLLTGCGGSTVTVTERVADTNGLVTVSSTITSDPQAIQAFTTKLVALDAGKPSQGIVQSGDVHVGSIICTYTLSKSGWNYEVTIYVVGRAPGAAALCSSRNQQSLLTQLP